ncbi:MAG: hypothetical protein II690_07400 [Ruminococcus sp.]|nr:hypothetical protein [Ruminococcus sp.]MBQ3916399.1 hypothetical protein [Ruminococcus sp.]
MNPILFANLFPQLKDFLHRHPKFFQFCKVAARNVTEGDIIEISVISSDGKQVKSNIRLSDEDMKFIQSARKVFNK